MLAARKSSQPHNCDLAPTMRTPSNNDETQPRLGLGLDTEKCVRVGVGRHGLSRFRIRARLDHQTENAGQPFAVDKTTRHKRFGQQKRGAGVRSEGASHVLKDLVSERVGVQVQLSGGVADCCKECNPLIQGRAGAKIISLKEFFRDIARNQMPRMPQILRWRSCRACAYAIPG